MKSSFSGLTAALVCVSAALSGIATPAKAAEPCKLVTQAQVSTALGLSVGPGVPIGTTGCQWHATGSSTMTTLSLWDGTKWDQAKAPLPGMTKTPAPGIGDDAFYSAMNASAMKYMALNVKKGATMLVIKIYGVSDQAKVKSAEQTMAADALANM